LRCASGQGERSADFLAIAHDAVTAAGAIAATVPGYAEKIAANGSAVKVMGDAKLKVIAAELITKVRTNVTIDWTLRESARAKIRVIVNRILNKFGYPPDLQEEAVKTVLMQAELLCAEWAVA
jgi:type I restriction enzyme R subunit